MEIVLDYFPFCWFLSSSSRTWVRAVWSLGMIMRQIILAVVIRHQLQTELTLGFRWVREELSPPYPPPIVMKYRPPIQRSIPCNVHSCRLIMRRCKLASFGHKALNKQSLALFLALSKAGFIHGALLWKHLRSFSERRTFLSLPPSTTSPVQWRQREKMWCMWPSPPPW